MDSDFARKNQAQFERLWTYLDGLGRAYIREIASFAVEVTPGFGNQSPEDTEYIPTGRLRGGWNLTRTPIERTSKGLDADRTEDGPFSDYGRETVARIEGQASGELGSGVSYLENDVAYGYIIVIGGGRHAVARNFPEDAATRTAQIAALRRAQQSMRR